MEIDHPGTFAHYRMPLCTQCMHTYIPTVYVQWTNCSHVLCCGGQEGVCVCYIWLYSWVHNWYNYNVSKCLLMCKASSTCKHTVANAASLSRLIWHVKDQGCGNVTIWYMVLVQVSCVTNITLQKLMYFLKVYAALVCTVTAGNYWETQILGIFVSES